MNDSERRICGSDALMDLDKQMAEIARHVELHQDSYKSDQRAFRKTLKACKGNEECLTATYQNRITQLQAVAEQLPPINADEAAKLETGATKAQEKWEEQAEARARWAEEEKDKPQPEVPMPTTLEVTAQPAQTVEPEVSETPTEPTPAVAPSLAAPPQALPVTKAAKPTISWGWLGFWGLIAICGLWAIKLKLEAVFNRCPRCRRWMEGEVKGGRTEQFMAMETRTDRVTHKDKHHQVTGYSERWVREPVVRTKTTELIVCRVCGHDWVKTSVS